MRKFCHVMVFSLCLTSFALSQDDPFGDLPPSGGGDGSTQSEVDSDWDSYPEDQGGGAVTCVKTLFGERCGAIFTPAPTEGPVCSNDWCDASSDCSPSNVVRNRNDYSTALKPSGRLAYIGETGITGTLKKVVCSVKAPCECRAAAGGGKACFIGKYTVNTTGTPPVPMTYMRWVAPSSGPNQPCPGIAPVP